MIGYYVTSAYRSHFDKTKFFATAEEAQSFDHGYAACAVGVIGAETMAKGLAEGDSGLKRLFQYLADETPWSPEAETPTGAAA